MVIAFAVALVVFLGVVIFVFVARFASSEPRLVARPNRRDRCVADLETQLQRGLEMAAH